MKRRILVVWNPKAGSKAGLPTNLAGVDDLRGVLDRHGLGHDVVESRSAEHASALARQAAADGIDVVAAAGGDGTAHVVARAVMGSATALGLLPMGSAMNLARALRIPRDLDEAAAVLASGTIRPIDVGLVRGEPFFEIVSIGLTAETLERAQALDREHRWRSILDVLRLALRYRRTRIELELDDGTLRTRALAVAVANGPHTGFGLTLAPEAAIDDGRLDVVVFENRSPLGLIATMVRAAGGREPPRRFRELRSGGIVVRSRRRLAVRADAADAGLTPVELGVRRGALRVVAPVSDARP